MAINREESAPAANTAAPTANSYVNQTESEAFNVEARPAAAFVAPAGIITSGWAAAKAGSSDAAVTGDYPVEFRGITNEAQLVKFIDADNNMPFANFRQHWLEKSGQKSYTCIGQACPICNVLGDKASTKRCFTIVNLSATPHQRQIITAGPRMFDAIVAAENSKGGPLKRNYWAITRIGAGAQTNYTLQAVKPTDLQEDWGMDPVAVEAAIGAFQPYDDSVIKINGIEVLREVVNQMK